jgi:hypothetical protein
MAPPTPRATIPPRSVNPNRPDFHQVFSKQKTQSYVDPAARGPGHTYDGAIFYSNPPVFLTHLPHLSNACFPGSKASPGIHMARSSQRAPQTAWSASGTPNDPISNTALSFEVTPAAWSALPSIRPARLNSPRAHVMARCGSGM